MQSGHAMVRLMKCMDACQWLEDERVSVASGLVRRVLGSQAISCFKLCRQPVLHAHYAGSEQLTLAGHSSTTPANR